jgi:hypothetical protein
VGFLGSWFSAKKMKRQYGSRYGHAMDKIGAQSRVKSGVSYADQAKAEDDSMRESIRNMHLGDWIYYDRLGHLMITGISDTRIVAQSDAGFKSVFTGVASPTPGIREFESTRYPYRIKKVNPPFITPEQAAKTEQYLSSCTDVEHPEVNDTNSVQPSEASDVEDTLLQPGCS